MKHIFFLRLHSVTIVLGIILVISLPIMPAYAAGTKIIGEVCSTDSDCASNDCEDSDLEASNDDFCDCDDANDCSIYGSGVWNCVDGNAKSHDLDFCTSGNQTKYPIPESTNKEKPGVIDTIADPESAIDQRELQNLISAPQPRIKIPGLTFTDPEVVKKNTKEETGSAGFGTYMSIPYIGEYLAVVYRYAVVVASVIAVLIIIIQGFVITTSGGSSERINHAKERIGQAVTGLLIAAASYIILFTINPELVQFRNLKVLYVAEKEFDDRYEDDFAPGEAASIVYKKIVNKGTVPCDYPAENGLVPIPTGIAGIKYVGPKGMGFLLPEVIEPLKKAGEYAAAQGYIIGISTACRPMATQIKFAESKASVAAGTTAKAGKSPHGFGYAVDIHLLKGGKDLSCTKDGCIFDKASQGPNGNQCSLAKTYPQIVEAREKASEFFAKAGWVRLTKESWHFEYGTANLLCRAQCSGPAVICGEVTNCPKNVNGCPN